MSAPDRIEITVMDASMAPMGQSVHARGHFTRLTADALEAVGGFKGGARWLRARLIPNRGPELRWALCEVAPSPSGRGPDALVVQACSLRLMPDFGGAALWLPNGMCTELRLQDFPGSDADALADLAARIQRWQSRFERGCASDPQPGEDDPFGWAAFQSHAAALALRSKSALEHPLHVRQPAEWRRSGGERAPGEDWIPDWEAAAELETRACERLEALDQKGFAALVAQGAAQGDGAPMPWAAYCAHMGLPQALRAVLAAFPGQAGRACAWGCSALEAALAAADADAVALCMDAGARSLPPRARSVAASLADASLNDGVEAAKAALAAWGLRGGSLEFSLDERERTHPSADPVFEWAGELRASLEQRAEIEALLGSAPGASKPAPSI